MDSFYPEKQKQSPQLIKENFVLKSINFIKDFFFMVFLSKGNS
jgi:hypothetical protein